MESVVPTREALLELVRYRMPFGKYKGARLVDLPEPYLVWFSRRGFPEGKLGTLLRSVYEMKANGLAPLLRELVERTRYEPDA